MDGHLWNLKNWSWLPALPSSPRRLLPPSAVTGFSASFMSTRFHYGGSKEVVKMSKQSSGFTFTAGENLFFILLTLSVSCCLSPFLPSTCPGTGYRVVNKMAEYLYSQCLKSSGRETLDAPHAVGNYRPWHVILRECKVLGESVSGGQITLGGRTSFCEQYNSGRQVGWVRLGE